MSSLEQREDRATTRVQASDTPRVDAALRVSVYGDVSCDLEVARQLERENAELLAVLLAVRDDAAEFEDSITEHTMQMVEAAIAKHLGGSSDNSPAK